VQAWPDGLLNLGGCTGTVQEGCAGTRRSFKGLARKASMQSGAALMGILGDIEHGETVGRDR
jgi:hypothetical protein